MYWEQIDDNHYRCNIFGGWLVKAYENVVGFNVHSERFEYETENNHCVSMCFVPDPLHQWEI